MTSFRDTLLYSANAGVFLYLVYLFILIEKHGRVAVGEPIIWIRYGEILMLTVLTIANLNRAFRKK